MSEPVNDPVQAPRLLVFDVNETLSDLGPLATRFEELGLPGGLAATWFAGVLRDGFALTVTGGNPSFADVAADGLRTLLQGSGADVDVDAAVASVVGSLAELPLHEDVVEGVGLLDQVGIRLVTLSNGSASVAQGLLERHGIRDSFTDLLSVEAAPRWKPAPEAYRFALEASGVDESDASQAMLVAAHPWDVHGAHHAGLATAWVNRSGAAYPRHFAAPDVECTSLVDLAAQLGAVSA